MRRRVREITYLSFFFQFYVWYLNWLIYLLLSIYVAAAAAKKAEAAKAAAAKKEEAGKYQWFRWLFYHIFTHIHLCAHLIYTAKAAAAKKEEAAKAAEAKKAEAGKWLNTCHSLHDYTVLYNSHMYIFNLNFIAKAAEAKKAAAEKKKADAAAAKKSAPAPVEKKEAPAPAPAPKPEPAPEPAPAPAPKPEPVVEAKKEEGEISFVNECALGIFIMFCISHILLSQYKQQLLHHLRHQFQPQQLLNQQRLLLDLWRELQAEERSWRRKLSVLKHLTSLRTINKKILLHD